jgi:hypothetical protein
MKNQILVALLLLNTLCFGQNQLTYKEVSEMQTRPLSERDLDAYESKDRYIYKVGDKIKIGIPSAGRYYSYLFTGDGIITPIVAANSLSAGHDAEIKKITISGTKRSGFYISLKMKGMIGFGDGYMVTNFETALSTGEIEGFGMTREQAISKLKEAKDLLDLGMMTQEEYDKMKGELSPIIMKKD